MDLAIIGAGPMGLFACHLIGRLGIQKVTIIDKCTTPGGQCSALYPDRNVYDLPGYMNVTSSNFIANLYKQASFFKPNFVLGCFVDNIRSIDNGHDKIFEIITKNGRSIFSKAILIATGAGVLTPNKPIIDDISAYEDHSVLYAIKNSSLLQQKRIAIIGGGDSAVSWGIQLSNIATKIYIIHRRDTFAALPHNIKTIHEISTKTKNKLEICTPYKIEKLIGDHKIGKLHSIEIIHAEYNTKRTIEVDVLIPCFGFATHTSGVTKWDIMINRVDNENYSNDTNFNVCRDGAVVGYVNVHQESMQTSIDGVFASGDAVLYNGKTRSLISGFGEVSTACFSIHKFLKCANMRQPLYSKEY